MTNINFLQRYIRARCMQLMLLCFIFIAPRLSAEITKTSQCLDLENHTFIVEGDCPDRDADIFNAVFANDIATFTHYLNHSGDPNAHNKSQYTGDPGETLLAAVIGNGRSEMAKLLQQHGVIVTVDDIKTAIGKSQWWAFDLFKAFVAKQGAETLNEFLIGVAADSSRGSLAMVRTLVESGADPEAIVRPIVEGKEPCIRTPIVEAMDARFISYKVEANMVLDYLVAEVTKRTHRTREDILAKYTADPAPYDCSLKD